MKEPLHKNCQNCNAPMNGLYCGRCGQKDYDDELKPLSIFLEWMDEHFGVNGTLWRTLKKLIVSPSYLPKRYIQGHRVGYIRPIRLLLTLTVAIVFINQALEITPAVPTGKFDPVKHLPEMAAGVYAFGDCEAKLEKVLKDFEQNHKSIYIKYLKEKKSLNDSQVESELERYIKISSNMCSYSKTTDEYRVVFYWVFIPLFTFLLWIAFRKKHQFKFMHILFYVLHYSSFVVAYSILTLLISSALFYFIGENNIVGLALGVFNSCISLCMFIVTFRNTFEIKGTIPVFKLVVVYLIYYMIYVAVSFSIGMGLEVLQ